MSEIARLHVSVDARTEDFKRNMGAVQNKMQQFGQRMSAIGRDMTRYITVPLAGAGIAAFKLGKDFEVEMTKITSLVGVASDQVDQWGRDILRMAPQLGKAPRELAEALFFVTSAGIRGAEAMNVLEMSAKASAAGLGETKVIADLVTSAVNAYGIENISAAQATDILVGAVREGKAEASELASSMGTVLPIAAEMGIGFEQVAAAQAAMTRTGTDAANASTQLRAIMTSLLSPSRQAEEALNEMGTSSADLRRQIREEGLLSALADLREMTNRYGEDAMAKVFPNVRALVGVLDLMGENMEDTMKIQEAMNNTLGLTDDAYSKTADTVQHKWNQAIAASQTAMIELWGVLQNSVIPVMETMTAKVTELTSWFSELDSATQETYIRFGILAAAAGPVLMVTGKLIASAKTLGGVLVFLAKTPIGLTIVALGALVAAGVYVYRNWEEIKVQLIAAWEMIRGAAVSVAIGVQRAWYGMQGVLWGVTRSILDAVAPLIEWLPGSITAGFERMRAGVGQRIGEIQGSMDDLSEAADENFARVRAAMTTTGQAAAETADVYGDQLSMMRESTTQTTTVIEESSYQIEDAMGNIGGAAGGAAAATRGATQEIAEGAKEMAEEIRDAAEIIREQYQEVSDKISLARRIHQAEFRLMRQEVELTGNEMVALAIDAEGLRREMKLQEAQVKMTRSAYEMMKNEQGETAEATRQLYLEFLNEQSALNELEMSLQRTLQRTRELTSAKNDLAGSIRGVSSASGGGGGGSGTALVPGKVFVGPDVPESDYEGIIEKWRETPAGQAHDPIFARPTSGPVTTGVHQDGTKTYHDLQGPIPTYGAGGIIPGPLGAPRLVMAHGGETVLPTHKQGMGLTVNITGNYIAGDYDVDRLMDRAVSKLRMKTGLRI